MSHDITFTEQSPRIAKNLTSPWWCNSVKGALIICTLTSLKGAITLSLCPIWMWEAIKGGLQPQSWHHGIISTWQWPQNFLNLIQVCWCNSVKGALIICTLTSLKDAILTLYMSANHGHGIIFTQLDSHTELPTTLMWLLWDANEPSGTRTLKDGKLFDRSR
jgi:hypothetical protein